MADMIRNIIQTHQERPIIKMAPDTVIYIDGLPYLINDYLEGGGTLVNFNDFVGGASGAVDVDTFIPACTVNLSVPNDMKRLFQGPGGQRIITVMSEIKVFTKGYYLTDEGESVYHRVFWGVICGISYSDNHKTLEINLNCKGILHLLDLMQINLNPSVMASTTYGAAMTPMVTKDAMLSPWHIILAAFLSPLSPDVLSIETVTDTPQIGLGGNQANEKKSFERAYITKWTKYQKSLASGVRLCGMKGGNILKAKGLVKAAQANQSGSLHGNSDIGATVALQTPEDLKAYTDTGIVKLYTPEFKIGNQMSLLQSTVVSRLSRIKEMVDIMGWEGFQDLDGQIIIKPPLYNLDCQYTDVGSPERNPFIVNLFEVDGAEAEVEDEGQVRLTVMRTKGCFDVMLGDGGSHLLHTGTWADPGLISRFGLRSEPPKQNPYYQNDSFKLFAYASAELTKVTRKYRTYTVTIPMRPELKAGFTIYMPHLDYYAYLGNISWAYSRGGKATMTLTCSAIRQREMFGRKDANTGEWVYAPIPNLVYCYTKAPAEDSPAPDGLNRITDPSGSAVTTKPLQDPSPAQKERIQREQKSSPTVATKADDQFNSWWVQKASTVAEFYAGQQVDKDYIELVATKVQPYTDANGYTLLRPFPWGRFIRLEEALDTFTRPESERTGRLLPFEGKVDTPGGRSLALRRAKANSFVMSALGTPGAAYPASGKTQLDTAREALTDVMKAISPENPNSESITYFVLSYAKPEKIELADMEFDKDAQAYTRAAERPTPGTKIESPETIQARAENAVSSGFGVNVANAN